MSFQALSPSTPQSHEYIHETSRSNFFGYCKTPGHSMLTCNTSVTRLNVCGSGLPLFREFELIKTIFVSFLVSELHCKRFTLL